MPMILAIWVFGDGESVVPELTSQGSGRGVCLPTLPRIGCVVFAHVLLDRLSSR